MITARCHPALKGLIPEPTIATLPDWLRAMPSEVHAETLGGEAVRTLKHCPPILDAMGSGIMMPLACDIEVTCGEFRWNWDMPVLEDARMSRAPLGLHVPEQATGAPFRLTDNSVLKFMNFWTLSVPHGFSLLFTHPLNREDLPFRTLSGVVDCDVFSDGYVHFPAIWVDPTFTGTLPRGTPVAQVLAFPRQAQGLQIAEMTASEIAQTDVLQGRLAEERGVYRKAYRQKR